MINVIRTSVMLVLLLVCIVLSVESSASKIYNPNVERKTLHWNYEYGIVSSSDNPDFKIIGSGKEGNETTFTKPCDTFSNGLAPLYKPECSTYFYGSVTFRFLGGFYRENLCFRGSP